MYRSLVGSEMCIRDRVDNIEITDEVHITAMTLITKSIKESGFYSSGTPFMKNSDWKKNAVAFKKLREITKK